MFKPGSIRKIQVQNFVTYSYVEMYPAPNLNMIIGPNGTGKSTMVAAIILGLGGDPKTVGRGKKISEYVKNGQRNAIINIYLQGTQNESYIQISREFDTEDHSVWKLNNRRVPEHDILEYIKQFNVQVNNLCQFLPQDRVADFAKLNKVSLLKETQRALCRYDLIEKQEILIEARSSHKNLLAQSQKWAQDLEEAQNTKIRLADRVNNYHKILKYKESINDIDRKIAWKIYKDMYLKVTEVQNDRTNARQVRDTHRDSIKPFEEILNKYKVEFKKSTDSSRKAIREIQEKMNDINNFNKKIDTCAAKRRDIENQLNIDLNELKEYAKLIEQHSLELEKERTTYSELNRAFQRNNMDNKRKNFLNEIAKLTTDLKKCQSEKIGIEETKQMEKNEIQGLQHEQSRLENITNKRLETLKSLSADAYTGLLWLRNNKHLFSGEICEPIIVEVNVLDPTKAKFLESSIAFRDKVSFICTNTKDMNLLIKILRVQQRLSVNILQSSPAPPGYNIPNIPIERLRQFGFYNYLNSLFIAPEPIMQFLCRRYNFHNIPVGDDSTDKCYKNVTLNTFYSDKFRYSASRSKYTQSTIVRCVSFKGDGTLSLSLDINRLENLKGRLNELSQTVEQYNEKIENFGQQINLITEKMRTIRKDIVHIDKEEILINSARHRISNEEKTIADLKNKAKSEDELKKQAQTKIKEVLTVNILLQTKLQVIFKDTVNLQKTKHLHALKSDISGQKIEVVENKLLTSRAKLQEAEATLAIINDRFNTIKQKAKVQLQKAKELSNGYAPTDDGFEEFRINYNSLADDLDELNDLKEHINAKIDCLHGADQSEMKQYEDNLEMIETLTKNIQKVNADFNSTETRMQRLQSEWLDPLKELIGAINLKFSDAFCRMGCAGEVGICHQGDEQNFEEYGLSIKVTFRDGEPLQELNNMTQSGGERAVGTAAFMLSLQELTPVPFRCVDEINQGMDANNERRIFELIVETTCQRNTSQYFLITPKLIPNLKYRPEITVHIVHNGPFLNIEERSALSNFCNPHGTQIN